MTIPNIYQDLIFQDLVYQYPMQIPEPCEQSAADGRHRCAKADRIPPKRGYIPIKSARSIT